MTTNAHFSLHTAQLYQGASAYWVNQLIALTPYIDETAEAEILVLVEAASLVTDPMMLTPSEWDTMTDATNVLLRSSGAACDAIRAMSVMEDVLRARGFGPNDPLTRALTTLAYHFTVWRVPAERAPCSLRIYEVLLRAMNG